MSSEVRRFARIVLLVAASATACGGSNSAPAATVMPTSVGSSPSASSSAPAPSGSAATAQSASTAPSASTSSYPSRPGSCPTSQLRVAFAPGQGAAGTFYSGIVFTNRGTTRCSIAGYPGVSLLDSQRQIIDQPAQRNPQPLTYVLLDPGKSATATLTVNPNYCSNIRPPGQASFIRVFPPGERADVVISADLIACHPIIRPVQPGSSIQPS